LGLSLLFRGRFHGNCASSVMAFFGILFVVLYGLNLKYLK
jgi:hypothetical protein